MFTKQEARIAGDFYRKGQQMSRIRGLDCLRPDAIADKAIELYSMPTSDREFSIAIEYVRFGYLGINVGF